MDDKERLISDREAMELVKASKKLQTGETVAGKLKESVIIGAGEVKIRAMFVPTSTFKDHKEKGTIIPFTAYQSGSKEVEIKGSIREEAVKRVVQRKERTILRGFIDWVHEKWEELVAPKDRYDERGFYYHMKYNEYGEEIAWVELENGDIATFVDDSRSIVEIDGFYYPMDASGCIDYSKELDYIGPHR